MPGVCLGAHRLLIDVGTLWVPPAQRSSFSMYTCTSTFSSPSSTSSPSSNHSPSSTPSPGSVQPTMSHQTVVSVAEARRTLSALLDRLRAGEVVLISRRGRPVAVLSAFRPRHSDAGVWLQRLQELHQQSC